LPQTLEYKRISYCRETAQSAVLLKSRYKLMKATSIMTVYNNGLQSACNTGD